MEKTEFIWHNGEFIPWDDAKVHVLTHTLHYGAGAFEGIRAYKTDRGPGIVSLKAHTERLFYTSEQVAMEIPFTKAEINEATIGVVAKNKVEHCYIRPLVFYGYGKMGLNPVGAPVEVVIACWPWGAYLPHDMVDLKVSKYTRTSPQSTVTDAKICGNYVNSILSVLELRGTQYHEALVLDDQGNIAEGPGENFFLIKDGKISTPKLGYILAGITRDTVMKLANDLGYEIEEKEITIEDALAGDEAFFTGTAAEVTPIKSIDDKVIGAGEIGPVTAAIRGAYLDLVNGKHARSDEFLTYVDIS